MRYTLAKRADINDIYALVQNTIKSTYPKYYPTEVVDFFYEHHSLAAITQDVENGNVSVLLVNGNMVGTGSFVDNHITRVYVLPEYQGMGYGTFIIKTIEEEILKKYDKAFLDASLPAAQLYEKLGYKTIKHEKYPVENGVILAYEVMEKELHLTDTAINYDGRKSNMEELSNNTYDYRKATIADINELVSTRIQVLCAANKLSEDTDMSQVERESYEYYKHALTTGEHIAYLVYDEGKFIGAGGVSFYQVMPTYHNPGGKKAYIMNMYTSPQYRRQGIAMWTLALLVKAAKEKGIPQISLEATEAGRPLYERFGFVDMENEMELV